MEIKTNFYSHGKVLISGEYLILDGATGLTVPTWRGQSMEVIESEGIGIINWQSRNSDNDLWFESTFKLNGTSFESSVKNKIAELIINLFEQILVLNPGFISKSKNYQIKTFLEFPNNWGLGSSSTFISNLAKWAQVDAYILFKSVLDGSGYDIAIAQLGRPLLYNLQEYLPNYKTVFFNPEYLEDLFFVHLGKKQISSKEVEKYKSMAKPSLTDINRISEISQAISECNRLSEFEKLIQEHETIVSKILNTKPIKERLFNSYPGHIKSLGAWGGDFILVTQIKHASFFSKLGFNTILPWIELIKP